jgi:hypothetical protein
LKLYRNGERLLCGEELDWYNGGVRVPEELCEINNYSGNYIGDFTINF